MIESLLLVDDENLFHLVFEDACSILDIALSLQTLHSADEAEKLFKAWYTGTDKSKKPVCVFVDLNLIGSSFNGIELIKKINQQYGNGVVIGIISSSEDRQEIENAKEAGAQFWMIKSDDIEPRLIDFKTDYPLYADRTAPFKIYK